MAIQWGGVAGIVFFYMVILIVGIWASKKTKGTKTVERAMIADRDIGWIVGLLTLIATTVGGAFINGTAEIVFTPGYGLLWAQYPWLFVISYFINGIFFVKKMREARYVTIIDPFQLKYGKLVGGLLFLPAVLGELFYTAGILAALGATINVILELDHNIAVIVSACIAGGYTLFGGLFSVAYTDIIQIAFVFVGLWICVPFAVTNNAVTPLPETSERWIGQWDNQFAGQWIDFAFLIIFGALPWQTLYQRALATKTPSQARYIMFGSAFGCLFFCIPAAVIGAVGASTDWSMTAINLNKTDPYQAPAIVLPAVIQYLTPPVVSFLGLGAVSAAVMSSTDSAVLASSTMFVRNIYKNIFRSSASERELLWVLRISVLVVATIATVIALVVDTIYGLYVLCGDFVYVLLSPQFICVVYMEKSNAYGSLVSFIVGLFLRLTAGEPYLHLPALIKYPLYDEVYGQLFPFRTLIAVVVLVLLIAVSYITDFVFRKGYLHEKYDVFKCVVNGQAEREDALETKSPPIEDKSVENVAKL